MRVHNAYKISDGVIEINAEVEHNVIIDIRITGNVRADPGELLSLLEKHLRGVELRRDYVSNAINVFYLLGVKTENVTKEQLVDAIMELKK